MPFDVEQFIKSGAIMSLTQDRLLLGYGNPTPMTYPEINPHHPAFYVSDFFLKSPKPWMQFPTWIELSLNELQEILKIRDRPSPANWTLDQPEIFQKAFQDLSLNLQGGKLKKAVPYLFAKSFDQMTEHRFVHSLKRAVQVMENKKGYLYGQWDEKTGLLGISPEILFSHSQEEPQVIQTMAVAGTCHPSQDQEAFFHNEKERHEHQLVVQGIRQSLEELGHIKIGELQLLKLPTLTHLMTPIELTFSNAFQFEPLIQRLHPTPALGAFPILEGKKWLEEFNIQTPRHLYGSPVGFHHPTAGYSRCFVAIRNVQWDSSGMRIGAGCGVVKQSTFENEWKEIQIKIRAIRDQLHL